MPAVQNISRIDHASTDPFSAKGLDQHTLMVQDGSGGGTVNTADFVHKRERTENGTLTLG